MSTEVDTKAKPLASLQEKLAMHNLYPKIQIPDPRKIAEDPEVKEFASTKQNLKGDELEEVITYMQRLSTSEAERERQIEAKAISLLGFTGLVTTFIIGFFQFGRDSTSLQQWLRLTIGLLYAAIGLSLLMTVLCAIEAVRVGKYPFMFPREEDLFPLTKSNRQALFQEHAHDLVKSYVFNQVLINAKASYISVAQNWFKIALSLLIVLLMIFGVQFISLPESQMQSLPAMVIMTATPLPSQTPVLASPTNSATYTATPLPLITPTT